MQTEFPRITAAIEVYLDALYFCDVAKLQSVFHPQAVYATADETPFLHRTMEEYFPIVAARQSPASRNEARRDHIDSIEFAGGNTAFARVRCSIGSRDFVDFLTFVKVDGVWQIIAKVFQIIERQAQET
jgi:hypothetical protein